MMKLKIAGGCGEHGRNCFYVELDDYAFWLIVVLWQMRKMVVIPIYH